MEQTEQDLINKNIRMNRFKVVTNIILIVVLVGIAFYVIKNIESFKMLSQDVCKLCSSKTGAICMLPIK
jgi:uncharacterized membrane protein YvbJ